MGKTDAKESAMPSADVKRQASTAAADAIGTLGKRPIQEATVTFRLPRELLDRVRQLAALEYESQSTMLRRLVRVGLERYRPINDPPDGAR